MSSRLRSSSVGAAPRQRKLSRSRNVSTVSTSLEVRCGCQYFQTDSLIPERVNPIGSRPTSRTEYYTEYNSRPTSRTELAHPTIDETKQPDQIIQNNLTSTTPRTSSLLLYRKYRSTSQDKTIKLPSRSDITDTTNFETTSYSSYNENKNKSSALLNRKYSRSRSRDILEKPKQFSSLENYKTDEEAPQAPNYVKFSSYEEPSQNYSSEQLDFETRNFGFGHLENCDLEIPETEITKQLSFESTASAPPIEFDSSKDFKTNIKVSNLISRSDITHAPIATSLPEPIIDPADIEDQETNNYHSEYYKEDPQIMPPRIDTPKYQSQNNLDTQSTTQRSSNLLARKYGTDQDEYEKEDTQSTTQRSSNLLTRKYRADQSDIEFEDPNNLDSQSTTHRTSNLLAKKYVSNSSQPTINLITTPGTSSNLLARKYRSVSQEKYPTNYKCSSLEGSTLDIQKSNKNVSFENNKHDLDQYSISKSDNRLSPVLYEVKNRLATIDRNW